VDLIAALFAVGTIYLAYFNFLIFKRRRAGTQVRIERIAAFQYVVAMGLYLIATALLIISAVISSTDLLVIAMLLVAAEAISRLVLSAAR